MSPGTRGEVATEDLITHAQGHTHQHEEARRRPVSTSRETHVHVHVTGPVTVQQLADEVSGALQLADEVSGALRAYKASASAPSAHATGGAQGATGVDQPSRAGPPVAPSSWAEAIQGAIDGAADMVWAGGDVERAQPLLALANRVWRPA